MVQLLTLSAAGALAVMMPAVVLADARLEASRDGDDGSFALTWPDPVQAEVTSDAATRELVLRFSRPLGAVRFTTVQETLGGLVETVEYGYDSVMVRLAPEVRAVPAASSTGVRVGLTAVRNAVTAPPPTVVGGLSETEWVYIAALEAAGNSGELVRFWSGRLAAGSLPPEQETDALHRLLALGADAAAMPHLERRARTLGGPWLYAFADAAGRVGGSDRLAAFLEAELRRGDLSPAAVEQRLALFYERAPRRAVQALAPLAAQRGGRWAAAHAAALARLGEQPALSRLLTDLAGNARLPPAERRAAAFRLLELGHRAEAADAYRRLAEGKPPNDPDVRQLLYLWGPRPGPTALAWIERRYAAAPTPEERKAWIGHLTDLGGAARAVVLLQEGGPATLDTMRDEYVAALAAAGDNERLGAFVSGLAGVERDVERLSRYAELAEYRRQTAAAGRAWKAVLELDPGNPKALRQAGALAFAAGRLNEAEAHLGRLLAAERGDFEANRLYAELLGALRKPGGDAYYRRALDCLAGETRRTEASYLAEAGIRARLKDADGVRTVMEPLLRNHPTDTRLVATYADLLTRAGRPELALLILERRSERHDG